MDSGVVAPRRWSRGKIIALLAAATLGSALLADMLFFLRPIAAEKLWIAALSSGVTPLQEQAVFRLRNYPTRGAAVALVAHIRAGSRSGDFKRAARAIETLCILSGRSFGATFVQHSRTHSCGLPAESEVPDVLAQIDHWAERAFGARR